MTDDIILTVLERYAHECAQGEHQGCEGRRECEGALESYSQQIPDTGAALFDSSKILLARGQAWPDETWPTTALLRLVKNSVLDAPYRDPMRRSLLITTALARLGERGIPADAVIRTCLGPPLVRHIIIQISAFWVMARDGKADRTQFRVLEPWLAAIDADSAVAALENPAMPDVVVAAIHGKTGLLAQEWVSNAAVAHIIGWRLGDHLRVELTDSERTLPAGKTATQWVVDRFTETYLDNWSRISLDWELVFLHSPSATALRTGLPVELLNERPTTTKQVIEALARRLSGSVGDDPVSGGLRPVEIVETIISLLRDGHINEACSLAQDAVQNAPENRQLLNAHAFCLMPIDADLARSTFDRLAGQATMGERSASQINLATLNLADFDEAATTWHINQVHDDAEHGGWFWDPVAFLHKNPKLVYVTFSEWHALAREAMTILTTHAAESLSSTE